VELALFRDLLARSAELSGKIFQLRESVPHRQSRFGVVDVHARTKLECGQRGRKHIDQPQGRVIGHQMASALLAVLPLARWRLLEHANMLGACRDPHGIGLPQRESIDRAA
jgi:hypothetical protein